MLTHLALLAITLGLGTASLFYFYWAFGGQRGRSLALPSLPRPSVPLGRGTALILGLFLMLLLLCGWLKLLPHALPFEICQTVQLGIALTLLMRALGDFKSLGFSKKSRASRFARWDDRLYSPLCLLLALCFAYLALTGR